MVLTPYDIIRIKNRLGVSATEFLNRYTISEFSDSMGLPLVLLNMRNDEKRRCPFVSSEGCTIYQDRPGTCRIYPLGRAARKESPQVRVREQYFVVRESLCLGFAENKEWTIDEWLLDQEMSTYNFFNDCWTEIVTSNPRLHRGMDGRKIQMFFMASYNCDMFRSFVLSPAFLRRFDVGQELTEVLKRDDIELMKFAMRWLRFSLFGENTMTVKDRGF